MNETIDLNPRQKAIINLLAQSAELSREQLADRLLTSYPASKATFARDLADLLEKRHIVALGNGPSRVYRLFFSHPLLKPIDLEFYFSQEPDRRLAAKTSFTPDIFGQLTDLLNPVEQADLAKHFRAFNSTTQSLSPTIVDRELERFTIELSWKSSKIEGNTYTLLETETLIKQSQEAPGHAKNEAIMILNHKDAFKSILDHRDEFKILTLANLTQLHQVLTKDLSIESGIRKHAVGITGTTYKPPDNEWQIREALEQLIQTVNNHPHPLEKALILAGLLAYLQPFADGNKRTARMLSNAILLAHDYFPLSYRSVDENEYKEALIIFYETNNLYHVKRIFLEQYQFALNTYFV